MELNTLLEKGIPVKGRFVKETRGYREADVQEFIQRIKATMLLTPSPTDRGEFIKWVAREIDKLSGFAKCVEDEHE